MRIRLIAIAALLTISGAAQAEPAKGSASETEQPHSEPAKVVVLAAAESAKPTATDAAQPAATQPRHRIGRVTTCRCGDPAPGDTTGENPEK
jgi:hypothetical protein